MKPGILIAPIWPRRLPKSTLKDIKVPALVTPLTPGYTPPDAHELQNRRAMNGGTKVKNSDPAVVANYSASVAGIAIRRETADASRQA
jgi:hypothetical protein